MAIMPRVFLFGGPNGAGKTTIAMQVLRDLGEIEFVNADSIAKGLSPFHPESVSVEAGKLMLSRMEFLLTRTQDFGFESTLASRSFQRIITRAKNSGYSFHLIFVHLQSVELAIARVKSRVAAGGHNIPRDTIIRRYKSGIENLRRIYLPLCDSFMIFDNSDRKPTLIAEGSSVENSPEIYDRHLWSRLIN
tara:strand:- start:274 stop:846 length:573 start_codon:yes stop_codon:yes gene_type:complete